MRHKLTRKDAESLLGQAIPALKGILDWDEGLSTSSRRSISTVMVNIQDAHAVIFDGKSPKQSNRKASRKLDTCISGAIWTCLDLHLTSQPYKHLPSYERYLVPLGYPDLAKLAAHLQSYFTPEMNWENRRKSWYLCRTSPERYRLYTTVNDQACIDAWHYESLRPTPPNIAKARARVAFMDSGFSQLSAPEDDITKIVPIPRAAQY